MKLSIFLLSALVALTFANPVARPVAVPVATTCSCRMPDSIQNGFETQNNPVFKAQAVEVMNVGDVHYDYTVMRVKVPFRGCPPQGEYIVIKSPKTEAACGFKYTPNVVYAVTAKLTRSSTPPPGLPANMEVYLATSCCFNKEWKALSYEDKSFLYYQPPPTC